MTQAKTALYAFVTSLAALAATDASAVLVLTVDEYTTDRLAFSIDGTLDADTTGIWSGYLAITNDWSNNIGTHTELFSGTPTVESYSLTIGGSATTYTVGDGAASYEDSFFFYANSATTSISAGTSVSGSAVLTGAGMFDPSDVSTLELVSGGQLYFDWDTFTLAADWSRFEASAVYAATPAVPLPHSAPLLAVGIAGLFALRRRRAI